MRPYQSFLFAIRVKSLNTHFVVKKDIFRLQVSGEKSQSVLTLTHLGNNVDHQIENTPVNNVKGVQVSQCTRHFSNVELCSGLRKGALLLKMEEKLENKTQFLAISHTW